MNKERTAQEFVDGMLANGRSWLDIIAVARVVRNGKWYDDSKVILQGCGKMPLDEAVIIKMRRADIAKKSDSEEKSRYATGRPRPAGGRTRSESSGQKD